MNLFVINAMLVDFASVLSDVVASSLFCSSFLNAVIDIIFLDKPIVGRVINKFLAFIKYRCSLRRSEETAVTGSYPQLTESIPNLHALYLRYILILFPSLVIFV